MSQLQFDASKVDPTPSFPVIPASIYLAQIVESEVKQTKAGTGSYAALTFEVLDGEHKCRRVFTNINIANANPEAERIGQKTLSQLCHAIGVLQLTDTVQLHNRPVRIKVVVKKDEQYGDKNEVKGFEAAAGVVLPPDAAAAAAAPAKAAPPWSKRAAA
jgi:hypothetical protein